MKQKPAERHFARNLNNKPCPCGAMKKVKVKTSLTFANSNVNPNIRCLKSDTVTLDEAVDEKTEMVPIKAKHCCLKRVEESYRSVLPKIVKNEGKRNWPKEKTNAD